MTPDTNDNNNDDNDGDPNNRHSYHNKPPPSRNLVNAGAVPIPLAAAAGRLTEERRVAQRTVAFTARLCATAAAWV